MRLQQQFIETVRRANYSLATERTYWVWIRQLLHFHNMRHPSEMGAPEITQFLSHLVLQKNVAISTQQLALNSLIFLYKRVLLVEEINLDDWVNARKPKKLPVGSHNMDIHHKQQTPTIRLSITPAIYIFPLYGCVCYCISANTYENENQRSLQRCILERLLHVRHNIDINIMEQHLMKQLFIALLSSTLLSACGADSSSSKDASNIIDPRIR